MSNRQMVIDALAKASVALDDMVGLFANDFCCQDKIRDAQNRVHKNGGTLSYTTSVQEEIQKAIIFLTTYPDDLKSSK